MGDRAAAKGPEEMAASTSAGGDGGSGSPYSQGVAGTGAAEGAARATTGGGGGSPTCGLGDAEADAAASSLFETTVAQ